jgi:hypothetical protein
MSFLCPTFRGDTEYAAFNTKTGEVLGKTAERHTSEPFIAFLTDLVATQPKGREIYVIADNLSAHKTKRVAEFLQTTLRGLCISRRRTPHGSTRSSFGSPKSSAMLLRGASSRRSTISPRS